MPSALPWLRCRSDDELLALLRARPDLTVPAPSDLSVLDRRLDNPTSVHRAMETLTAFEVTVLTALVLAGAPRHRVSRSDVLDWLGAGADPAELDAALARLERTALIRPVPDDPGLLEVATGVPEVLGPHPGGLGAPGELTVDQAATALASLPPRALALLGRLDAGSPRGLAPPGGPSASTVSELVRAGLLTRVDTGTVELPRQVGLALRGEHPLGSLPTPPELPDTTGDAHRVDGTAAGQALATLQLCARLVEQLGRRPAPALKSGGIGVRELRRLAKDLGIEVHRTALLLELLAAGGMVTTDEPRGARSATWQPTPIADELLGGDDAASWAQLARLWLDLRRDPARAGGHDETDRVTNVLAPELSWLRGPTDRRFVLRALADLPPGTGVGGQALTDYLAWRAPLRSAGRRAALQRATTAESTWLGVVAFDAITTAGRALIGDDPEAAERQAAEAMAAAFPAPVDQVLVQADLTVVAPGRLVPELASRLEQVAIVESSGSATVYRVTPGSIRAALDAGISAADLHALFAQHSATGVPQALDYLIDDTARRHGVLRIGGAASYLRSEDTALLTQAVAAARSAGFVLRTIAPTVAIGAAPLPDLLEALSEAGIGVTAEDNGGAVLSLRPAGRRTRPGILTQQRRREPALPSDGQLTALIGRMRAADQASTASGSARRQTATEAVSVLRDAARTRRPVWIGYVDAEGTTSRREVEPVVVSGGMLVAYDRLRSSMKSFALHRVTDAVPAADPGLDPGDGPAQAGLAGSVDLDGG